MDVFDRTKFQGLSVWTMHVLDTIKFQGLLAWTNFFSGHFGQGQMS